MVKFTTIFVTAASLTACHTPTPSAPPEAAFAVDVPTHMDSVADALIDKAVKNRFSLDDFRLELKRELGRIYAEGRVGSSSFSKGELERGGWNGETIYSFSLDACYECTVYVNRKGIIVGPVDSEHKVNKGSLTGHQPINLPPSSIQSRP